MIIKRKTLAITITTGMISPDKETITTHTVLADGDTTITINTYYSTRWKD